MELDMKSSSILLPSKTRPPMQSHRSTEFQRFLQMLRMNIAISTWLLTGAFLQSLLVLTVPTTYAVLPPIFLLAIRCLDKISIASGLRNGLLTDGVIMKKTTAQIPTADSRVSSVREGGEEIVIFLIGAKSNHALGMFAPGFKELGDRFYNMAESLSEGAIKNGFLRQTSWTNIDSSGVAESMAIQYWRSIQDLHAFAHSPIHRESWVWWESITKTHKHLAIYHEVYAASSKQWETVYVNCEPTGLGATTFLAKDSPDEKGMIEEDVWVSPLRDASTGRLSTMLGRMNRGTGKEHDKYASNSEGK